MRTHNPTMTFKNAIMNYLIETDGVSPKRATKIYSEMQEAIRYGEELELILRDYMIDVREIGFTEEEALAELTTN